MHFLKTLREYQAASSGKSLPIRMRHLSPILGDFKTDTSHGLGHYFHQDLWAARKIYRARPSRHIDIGSRIDGFVSHVLLFMPVTVIDIRPLGSDVEGLTFIQDDATQLHNLEDHSVESLSSLHALEHFGLGRFGDPVDPDGCFKVMDSMARVLKPGGKLYFSVPIGLERLEFNAHRVFNPAAILDAFKGLSLLSFSAVNDRGDLVADASPDDFTQAHMACGLFEFTL